MTDNSNSNEPIEIQWLNASGQGGSKTKDGVVTVQGALPGDVVTWSDQGKKGRQTRGVIRELISSAPIRTTPPCSFNSSCGGCDLSYLARDAREKTLTTVAANALRVTTVNWFDSPRQTHHRARIKLGIADGVIGYRSPRSHTLVPIDTCLIAREELNEAIQHLRHAVQRTPSFTGSVELCSNGEEVRADLTTADKKPLTNLDPWASFSALTVNGHAVQGMPHLFLNVADLSLRVGPGVFYQVNLEINALLVQSVLRAVHEIKPTKVLDLFSGMGNFGIPLANTGVDVTCVEQPGRAIEDCKHSVRTHGLEQRVDVLGMNAKRFDPSRTFFDVAIVDPPRVGTMGKLEQLVQNRPTDIFYVSCHLSSAAREIKAIEKNGYSIHTTTCFDMFPDTHHFETLIHLKRR